MQHRSVLSQLVISLLVSGHLLLGSAHADEEAQVAVLSLDRKLSFGEAPLVNEDDVAVQELRPLPPLPDPIDLTAPTDDLWVRIRNGFSMPGLNNELVLQQQQWYLNHPDYLRRMVERSRRYLHHIVEELEKRGMPMELALLPMVESSFNPMAYSKAHASGLWQFIPSTGKRYDLKQNWWHDLRRDIVASTSAALDYLQAIYDMHGDWHLALASYNWGEGSVKRAIQKNAAKGLPTDYSSLTMPAETRHYVPKLMALKNIFANPKTVAELRLPAVPNRPYFAAIEPNKPIDVKIAAKLAEMSVDDFVALNPAHNRPVIKPATPLIIPADKLEKFQANLENHEAPLATWQVYTLKNGDRLDKLAPKFGISLEDLKRVNGLKGRLKISAGSSLLVPAKGGADIADLPDDVKLPEAMPDRPVVRKLVRGKGGRLVAVKVSGGKKTVAGKNARQMAKGKGGAGGRSVAAATGKGKPTVARGAATKSAVAGKPRAAKVTKRGSGRVS